MESTTYERKVMAKFDLSSLRCKVILDCFGRGVRLFVAPCGISLHAVRATVAWLNPPAYGYIYYTYKLYRQKKTRLAAGWVVRTVPLQATDLRKVLVL